MGEHNAMAHGPLGSRLQPGLLARGGGGIVGKAQHHQAQIVPLAGADLIEIGRETLLSRQGQEAGPGRGQMQATQMGGVVGIKQQSLIAGIQQRQGQVGGALLGAHQQQHLPLRIHRYGEAARSPGSHRLAQGQGGAVQAVGSAGGLAQLAADRFDRLRRRLQVGGAEREIQQGRQALPGLGSSKRLPVAQLAPVITGEDTTAEALNPVRQPEPAGRRISPGLLRGGHPGTP